MSTKTTIAAMDMAERAFAELDRLRADNARLRAALKPFAECHAMAETEVNYLIDCPNAVEAARAAYGNEQSPSTSARKE